jgi:hypothetical protein
MDQTGTFPRSAKRLEVTRSTSLLLVQMVVEEAAETLPIP